MSMKHACILRSYCTMAEVMLSGEKIKPMARDPPIMLA